MSAVSEFESGSDLAKAAAADIGQDGLAKAFGDLVQVSRDLLQQYASLEAKADRVEQELERANAELETLVDSLPLGVVLRDAQGRVVRANPSAARLLGCSTAQLQEPADDLLARADSQSPHGTLLEIHNEPRRLATRQHPVTRNGLEDPEWGTVQWIEDRTKLEQMHRRVAAVDKMAALGTMAAGIAHEIRNPLNAISGFASLLAKKLGHAPQLERWATAIVEGSAETEAIIAGLLHFARPGQVALETVATEGLLTDAIAGAFPGSGPPAGLEIRIDSDEQPLQGDRIKLRQALRNLIRNAADHTPLPGTVRVRVEHTALGACVTVEDSGPGIPKELHGRVLEPFFTTRPEGTGLGLALVHAIAEVHGGSLEISPTASELGGAAIRLRLPITSPSPTPPSPTT